MLWQALAWTWLMALPLAAASSSSSRATWSEDEDTITRYKVGKFGVRLSPTPPGLDLGNAAIQSGLRQTLESTLFAHISKEWEDFEYVWLLGVESVSWTIEPARRQLQEASTTVVFEGASISFDSPVDTDIIDEWVEKAITEDLADKLNTPRGGPFAQVTTAEYISFAVLPTPAPVGEKNEVIVVGAQVGEFAVPEEDNGLSAGKIVGSILGVLLVVAGVALLVGKKQRYTAVTEIMRDLELDEAPEKRALEEATVLEEDFMTENGDDGVSEMAACESGGVLDSVSVVSEFTITEDASRASNPNKTSTAVYTENFDRETRLQKDMLQGEWSLPPTSSSGANDVDSSELVAKGMSFEKAYVGNQGEEIYLMPPSKKRQRGVSC
jgi:hypothetical protein